MRTCRPGTVDRVRSRRIERFLSPGVTRHPWPLALYDSLSRTQIKKYYIPVAEGPLARRLLHAASPRLAVQHAPGEAEPSPLTGAQLLVGPGGHCVAAGQLAVGVQPPEVVGQCEVAQPLAQPLLLVAGRRQKAVPVLGPVVQQARFVQLGPLRLAAATEQAQGVTLYLGHIDRAGTRRHLIPGAQRQSRHKVSRYTRDTATEQAQGVTLYPGHNDRKGHTASPYTRGTATEQAHGATLYPGHSDRAGTRRHLIPGAQRQSRHKVSRYTRDTATEQAQGVTLYPGHNDRKGHTASPYTRGTATEQAHGATLYPGHSDRAGTRRHLTPGTQR